MTVGELRVILAKFPDAIPVMVRLEANEEIHVALTSGMGSDEDSNGEYVLILNCELEMLERK